MTSHFALSRQFLPLFLTQFFGAFNDNAYKNAILIWFTYQIGTYKGINAGLMVTLAAALFILPFFLFSSFAGNLSDKYEKTTCIRWIKAAEVVLMLMGGVFFLKQSVPGLLTVLFLTGIQSTFFGPIKYSLLPLHLPKNKLLSGNALIEMGTFLAIILGTIFGAWIINKTAGVTWLIIALAFFALLGWISSFFIPMTHLKNPKLKLSFRIIQDSWKMLSLVKSYPLAWHAIKKISWFWVIGMCFLTQIPIYTETIIHGNENLVTLLLCVFCLGISAGSVAVKTIPTTSVHIPTRFNPLTGISISIMFMVFFSWNFPQPGGPSHYYILNFLNLGFRSFGILISFFALSFFSGLFVVPQYTQLQSVTEKHLLSRTIAANNIMNSFWMVLCSVGIMLIYKIGFNVLYVFGALTLGTFLFFIYSAHSPKNL